MSIPKATFWITAFVLGLLVTFYYFSSSRLVRIAGAGLVLWWIWTFIRFAKLHHINKVAFQVAGNPTIPMLRERRILGLIRGHAKSGEDHVMSILANYTILITLLGITINPWWLCVAAFLSTFYSYHGLRRTWPAYALILGASNRESTRALTRLVTISVAPLCTTNLLEMVTKDEIDHEVFRATSYRLHNEFVSWEAAVEIHAAFARVIVVDVTDPTPAVLDELKLICKAGFWYKSIFYCPSDQSVSAVTDVLVRHPESFVAKSKPEITSALAVLVRHLNLPATSDRPVAQIVSGGALQRNQPLTSA